MVDLIKDLCSKNKITIKSLEKELKFGNGTIRRWDDKKPSYDRIAKVAEYFGVTVDYLLGVPPTGHIDMIEEVHGKEAADAYINGGYVAFSKIVDENEKKPAPIAESELDNALIKMLVSLTPSELMQVDAFVQGLIAARKA